MRDGVAHTMRFPREVNRLELRAARLLHFVRHSLAAIPEHVEKFVEHHVGLENSESPALLVVGMRPLKNVIPAELRLGHVFVGNGRAGGLCLRPLMLAYLPHPYEAVYDRRKTQK